MIITHLPGYESKRAVIYLLRDLGLWIVDSRPNIVVARTWDDPVKAAHRLKEAVSESGYVPILRIIPVRRVTNPYVDAVREAVHAELRKAGEGSFAIRLDGYLYDDNGRLMHRMDSIRFIAEGVDRKVDLSDPDILVYIKVVRVKGRYMAGIYVGIPGNIISLAKEKLEGMER